MLNTQLVKINTQNRIENKFIDWSRSIHWIFVSTHNLLLNVHTNLLMVMLLCTYRKCTKTKIPKKYKKKIETVKCWHLFSRSLCVLITLHSIECFFLARIIHKINWIFICRLCDVCFVSHFFSLSRSIYMWGEFCVAYDRFTASQFCLLFFFCCFVFCFFDVHGHKEIA